MSSAERETIPAPAEPSIPERAPDSAASYALAIDRLTGGDGEWLRNSMPELGLTLGD